MTAPVASSMSAPRFHLAKPIELTVFALCVALALYLPTAYALGCWIIEPNGYTATDFGNAFAAGKLALQGMPAAAYDIVAHKQALIEVVGHDFAGSFPWYYPPTYFFVAVALASFPYAAAWVGWLALTFPIYLATMRAIIGDRVGILLACAFPAILSNFLVGQNGFLTAGLLGGSLVMMERRPWLAGCLLGLLTYKPHLGLLFPIVLIAAGQWRVFLAASAVAGVLMAASLLAFGLAPWDAFFHALSSGTNAIFSQGYVMWGKLQSVFGLVRWMHGGETLAWFAQATTLAASAILLCTMWRSRLPFALKAAALATGALLSTPYLFLYDLVAAAVPMAFLLRAGFETEIAGCEWIGLGIASLAILLYPAFEAPVGVFTLLIVAGLIARRVIRYAADAAQDADRIAAPSTAWAQSSFAKIRRC
jgi:arabinofuranan 3-O-arabinosyltransferase